MIVLALLLVAIVAAGTIISPVVLLVYCVFCWGIMFFEARDTGMGSLAELVILILAPIIVPFCIASW